MRADGICGERQRLQDGFLFGSLKQLTVDSKKCVGGHESGTLVPVKKRVVFDDAFSVGGSEVKEARFAVMKQVQRTVEGGIEQTIISNAGQSTEPGKQLALNRKNRFSRQPERFAHLASSRSAFR